MKRFLSLSLIGLVVTALHAPLLLAQQPPPPLAVIPGKPATAPRQAWAHRDGMVNLKLLVGGIDSKEIAARLSIQDSFARWGIAYDEARLDVVRSLFTKDATYKVTQGAYQAGNEIVGVDAIVSTVANALKGQADQRRHAISNVVIEKLGAHEASAIAYGIVTVAADGLTLGATVIYSADLRREADGAWRFSRFVIGMDHYAGRAPTPLAK